MAEKWYCKLMDQEIGPFTVEQIKRLAAEKRLTPIDPVRREGDEKWHLARQIKGLFSDSAAAEGKSEEKSEKKPETPPETPDKTDKKQEIPKKRLVAKAIIDDVPEIPRGIPVSQVSQSSHSSGNIPRGIPVGVPQTPPSAARSAGFSASPQENIPAFSLDFGPPSGGTSGGKSRSKNRTEDPNDPAVLKKQKKQQQFLILASATGGVGLLAIALILFLVFGGSKPDHSGKKSGDSSDATAAKEPKNEQKSEKEPEPKDEDEGSILDAPKPKVVSVQETIDSSSASGNDEISPLSAPPAVKKGEFADYQDIRENIPQDRGGVVITPLDVSVKPQGKYSELAFTLRIQRKTVSIPASAWKAWLGEIETLNLKYADASGKDKDIQGTQDESKGKSEDLQVSYSFPILAGTPRNLVLEIPGPKGVPYKFLIPAELWENEALQKSLDGEEESEKEEGVTAPAGGKRIFEEEVTMKRSFGDDMSDSERERQANIDAMDAMFGEGGED